jgi:hypothetical protein
MYHVEGTAIAFSNGKRHTFKNFITEVLEFDDAIIVLLNDEPMQSSNENVYSFDYNGLLLWQIPLRQRRMGHSPFVTIARNTMFIDAFNWDGSVMTLHPSKGFVIREDYASVGSFMPHRVASPRRWM